MAVFTSSRCQRAIASGAPLIFQSGAANRQAAGAITLPSDVGSGMIQNAARRRLSRSDYALV
jgi:hypothetical protein